MKTAAGGQVVVALGAVEADLVTEHLPPDARFVADPGAGDLRDATGAIVRADALVDTAMLDRMPNLRVLARTGVGVERVDVDEATRRGIAVVVTPGAGTHAVAEGALAMILHLVKRLRATTECVARGRWSDRGAIAVGDLDGATIGIVGYGRIGRRVGHLARAFGMTVLAHDPYLPAGTWRQVDGRPPTTSSSSVSTNCVPVRRSSRCTCRSRRRPATSSTRPSWPPCRSGRSW